MAEQKHTPGALKAARIIIGETGKFIDTEHGRKTVDGLADLIDSETGLSDLLAACVGLVRAWERDEPMHDGNPRTFSDPIGQARLAIAKAKEVRDAGA